MNEPAGNYLVVGSASLINIDGDRQVATCSIQGGVVVSTDMAENSSEDVSVLGTVTLATAGNITLSCGGFKIFGTTRMFVIPVASVVNG